MKTNFLRLMKWFSCISFMLFYGNSLNAQFNYDVYVYDLKNGTTRQVSSIPNHGEYNSSWSPNSKKIAHEAVGYIAAEDLWYQNIYVTDVESGESTPLAGGENGNDATWSPNGQKIMFDAWWWYIYSVPATGGIPTLLREGGIEADWAPNGLRIVFLDLHEPYDLKTMSLVDGTETIVASAGENPVWSPNGNYIAYQSWYGGIWIVRVDMAGNPKEDPIQLTTSGVQPTWSNNSKTIAYSDNGDIYSISVNGGIPVKVCGLPNPDFGNYDPCYSNNGQYIAFSAATVPPIEPPLKSLEMATLAVDRLSNNLQVSIRPNPGHNGFLLTTQSSSSENISLRIMDVQGRTILNQNGIQPNGSFDVRNDFGKGIYFAEIRQGLQRKVIKLPLQ